MPLLSPCVRWLIVLRPLRSFRWAHMAFLVPIILSALLRVRCLLWGEKLRGACNTTGLFIRTIITRPHFSCCCLLAASNPRTFTGSSDNALSFSPYLHYGTPGLSGTLSVCTDLGPFQPTSASFRPIPAGIRLSQY